MAAGMAPVSSADHAIRDPSARGIWLALAIALLAVFITRLPVARTEAFEFDEVGYLEQVAVYRLPMHHTLFLAAGRLIGDSIAAPYRGFVLLDSFASALALVAVWWWLRALAPPKIALAGTVVLGAAPVFWSYGAMAGNYAAIPLVGSILLGIAYRGIANPRSWHPYIAALALAIGAGYRQDIGTFWMPVFLVILWRHRWLESIQAGLLFVALCLCWFVPMLRDTGGWTAWRAESARFAYNAGYLNSYWHLGFIDAPARYVVKGGMALLWTLGPGLLFAPRGAYRLKGIDHGFFLMLLLPLSVLPALGSHLMVHFGVPGYAFHYIPALLALVTLGIGRSPCAGANTEASSTLRLAALAAFLATVFLCYPTKYDRPGLRGSFDLAFARHTRVGLRTPLPQTAPAHWRTANSQTHAGAPLAPRIRIGRSAGSG